MYYSLVQSHPAYGILAYNSLEQTNDRIKKIIKVMLKKNTYSTGLLHKETRILNLRQLFFVTSKYQIHNKHNCCRITNEHKTRNEKEYYTAFKNKTISQRSYE